MADRRTVSSRARARRRRQQRLRMGIICAVIAIVAAALVIAIVVHGRSASDAPRASGIDAAPRTEAAAGDAFPAGGVLATNSATAVNIVVAETPVPTPEATPTPTPALTAVPAPTPTAVPGSRPDVVSFYTPKGKSYSPRVRMGDTFTAVWKKGKDIGSFEVIASDAQELDGSFFGDIFGAAWKAFPDADSCKIGYTLRYTLDDGTEIKYSMLSPKHIRHTEYIECWLYDDYHRKPHQFYSHLKSVKSSTLMTSIKLTCGPQISHVTDIWLTAFICSSLDEFDEEQNYTGSTSCTIHILKK